MPEETWEAREYTVFSVEPVTVICHTALNKNTRTPKALANARLIAAAPDLLEAITPAVLRCLRDNGFDASYRKLAAAIAKATGK